MLREPDLDLKKSIQPAQAADDVKQHLKDLSSEMSSSASAHHLSRNFKANESKVSKSPSIQNKTASFC